MAVVTFDIPDALIPELNTIAQNNDFPNAKEMVKSLNVEFNKARQAAITTELIEIISGVESMK